MKYTYHNTGSSRHTSIIQHRNYTALYKGNPKTGVDIKVEVDSNHPGGRLQRAGKQRATIVNDTTV